MKVKSKKKTDWECQVCGKNRKACWGYDDELRGWINTAKTCVDKKPVTPNWADNFGPEDSVKPIKNPRRCMRCGDHAEQCACGNNHYVIDTPLTRFIAGVD